jgi:TP901 family phage tail tape measure protein
MTLNVGTLSAKLDLDSTNFDTGVASAGSGIGKLGTAAAVAGVAAVAAVGAVGVKSVMAFAEFEKGMNEVFTLLPGTSQAAMDEMSTHVKSFSTEFGVLPEKVVPALYQALSAGVPKENVFEFLEVAQKAARGGVTDLATAVNGVSGVVNAYGADVVDASKASDLMFTTVKLGKTTFAELSASLGDVTPIASSMGVSFEEVSAAMAASTLITGNTAKSTTGLKGLLAELGKEGQIAAKNFQAISGKTFPDFIKGGGNLGDALKLMKDHATKTGGSVMDMFGGIEAGQSALQLTGSDVFVENLEKMQDSAGATDAANEQMSQGLSFQFDKIKAYAAVAFTEIGEKLAPMVGKALDKVIEIATKLKVWWDANGPAIKEQVKAAFEVAVTQGKKVFDTVKNLVTKFVEFATKVKDNETAMKALTVVLTAAVAGWVAFKIAMGITNLISAVQKAITGLNAALAANPIVFVVMAVAALIALVVAAYFHFDGFRKIVDAAWQKIQEGAKAVWSVLSTVFSAIADWVTGTLVPAFKSFWESAKGVFASVAEAASSFWNNVVKPVFEAIKNHITEVVIPGFKLLWEIGKTVFFAIADAVSWFWNSVVKPVFEAVKRHVTEVVIPGFQLLWDTAKAVFEGVAKAVMDPWNNVIKPVFEAVKNFVTDTLVPKFQELWDKAKAVFEGLKTAVSNAWSAISPVFESLKNGLTGVVNWIGDRLGDSVQGFKNLGNRIGEALGNVAEAIKAPFRSAFNAVKGIWNDTVGGFRFTIPAWIPGVGGKSFSIPNMHVGGVVPGLPGSEQVTRLAAGETVRTVSQEASLQGILDSLSTLASKGLGAAGAGVGKPTQFVNVTVPVVFNGPVAKDSERWVVETFENALRNGGKQLQTLGTLR